MDSENVMIVAIPQEAYERITEAITQKSCMATLHECLKGEILLMDLDLLNQVEALIKSRPELGYCCPQDFIIDAITQFFSKALENHSGSAAP